MIELVGDEPKRAGYTFGQDITEQFNHNNGLALIAVPSVSHGRVFVASRQSIGNDI